MFTVTIYDFAQNPLQAMHKLNWKESNGTFYQSTLESKKLLAMTVEEDRLTAAFAERLSFKEFKAINKWLTELLDHIEGKIDDVASPLGFLEDSTPAYIVTNWEKWERFILTAQLRTLEGEKVKVLTDEGKQVEEGLLVSYTEKESPSSMKMEISACTVITLFGERKVSGDNLTIEAVFD